MHVYGVRCHDERIHEIEMFDKALANGCMEVQTIGIEMIDEFLNSKSNFQMDLKHTFQLLAKSTDDIFTKNHNQINTISDNFATIVDNIWYTLIELETSVHERIIDSMHIFSDTIRTLIQNFNDKTNETFSSIRSACDAYFSQSNIDCVNKTISNDDQCKTQHLNIINHKHDVMRTRSNKWLNDTIDAYEL